MTPAPPSRRRPVLIGAAVVVLLGIVVYLVAFAGDDDDPRPPTGRGDDDNNGGETTADTAPAGDGTAPDPPDLSQELATSISANGHLGLVVNELRQEGDRVTVWVTLTNNGDDPFTTTNGFTDPTLGPIERNLHADVSGMYLIDWNAGTAYYPMAIDDENCLCSKGRFEIAPEASLSIFAVYNGVGELEEGTLVLPEFLPADGLSPA